MKKIILLLSIVLCSLTSCIFPTEAYVTTQDDIYVETSVDVVRSNVDYNVVIRYGTPYYYQGSLLYYLYDGLYYYPYSYNNYWYVRAYRRPFNHLDTRPYFRPHRYDHKFERGYRPQPNWYRNDAPRRNYVRPEGNRPDVRPDRPMARPDTRMSRPNQPNIRQSQPTTQQRRVDTPSRTPQTRTTAPATRTTAPSRGGNFGGRTGGGRR